MKKSFLALILIPTIFFFSACQQSTIPSEEQDLSTLNTENKIMMKDTSPEIVPTTESSKIQEENSQIATDSPPKVKRTDANSNNSANLALSEKEKLTHDNLRKADLHQIAAAVEMYNAENGKFPSGKICLSPGNVLDNYFAKKTPPLDPQTSSAMAIADCPAGQYLYCELPGNSAGNYYLASFMETVASSNIKLSTLKTPFCGTKGLAPDPTIEANKPIENNTAFINVH